MDATSLTNMDNYADFNSLNALRYQAANNQGEAKKEVAEKFESLLVQMLLKSMREANNALTNDSQKNEQKDLYTDLLDKQFSLVISHSGTGLATIIEESLKKSDAIQPATPDVIAPRPELLQVEKMVEPTKPIETSENKKIDAQFDSTSDFVKTLWSSAKTAASILGADPKFLLAQAALETNWGKSILPMAKGQSTHNLFNIKADSSWASDSVQVDAIEYEDGVIAKNKSKFRAYDSYNDSFNDYVHFLKNNSRYEEALKHASDPHQFAEHLQKANYATDEKYSEKIMKIYSGKRLNDVIAEQKLI